MSIALAIDYGTKRCGIAVSDVLQIIATGLTTVPTHELLTFLDDYMKKEQVSVIVIGDPKRLDNSEGIHEPQIKSLINKIQLKHPEVKIERIDERFTTKIAQQTLIEGGVPKMKRRNKALHDQISATLILQSWLYYK
jgi:putative Holliday junction resolvase